MHSDSADIKSVTHLCWSILHFLYQPSSLTFEVLTQFTQASNDRDHCSTSVYINNPIYNSITTVYLEKKSFLKCSLPVHYFFSLFIWTADCMQFLPENRLNRCQISERFYDFYKLIFGFLHAPNVKCTTTSQPKYNIVHALIHTNSPLTGAKRPQSGGETSRGRNVKEAKRP